MLITSRPGGDMATAFESEASIGRSATEVWAALVDWPRAPTWMRGIDRIAADGPAVAGTKLTFAARGADRPARIIEVDEGRRLVLLSEQGPVAATYRYEIESIGDERSVIRLHAECDVGGPLRILAPLIRRVLRRTDGGQPEALRAMLER